MDLKGLKYVDGIRLPIKRKNYLFFVIRMIFNIRVKGAR